MAYHPINLAIRFLLELVALGALATFGWRLTDPVPIPGTARLLLELLFFGAATWALSERSGVWATAFAGVVLIHYVVSLERVLWLFGSR